MEKYKINKEKIKNPKKKVGKKFRELEEKESKRPENSDFPIRITLTNSNKFKGLTLTSSQI